MTDITINASVRNNLLSLQRTTELLDRTASRLSTGKKVNSPIDDPVSFFTAKGLTDRASDLFAVKDGISQGLNVLSNSINALETIEDILKQMKGLAASARASSDATERASLASQYDALTAQITSLTGDSSYNGINLLKGTPDSLTVKLNEKTSGASLTVAGVASDGTGLSIAAAGNAWVANSDVDTDVALIDAAIAKVRQTSSQFGNHAAFLNSRLDFTDELVTTLENGAGQLVNADLDEEGANMLALQTRQQLAMQALSFSNQSESSILALFR